MSDSSTVTTRTPEQDAGATTRTAAQTSAILHAPGRIVIGYDGSGASRAALRWGSRRAAATRAPVIVVHAFAPDLPLLGFGSGSDLVRAEGDRLLATATAEAHAVDRSLEVATSFSPGFPSAALISHANHAGMIVVGSVGHGTMSRTALAPVTLQVAAHAPCPVAIVGREGPEQPTHRIVVGVDGSPDSHHALRTAIDMARQEASALLVSSAWQPVDRRDRTLDAGASWSAFEAERRADLESAIRAVGGSDGVEVTCEVVAAEPARHLAALSTTADLLVVGARGAGGFTGLRLGSVTTTLMGRTDSPLLIARH